MEDKTAGERMKRMRESRRRWLATFARGLSADGLIGALVRGDAKLVWIVKDTEKKVSRKK